MLHKLQDLVQQAKQAFEKTGEKPDGEVLLSATLQELRDGLGFGFTLAKKVMLRLQQAQTQAQVCIGLNFLKLHLSITVF